MAGDRNLWIRGGACCGALVVSLLASGCSSLSDVDLADGRTPTAPPTTAPPTTAASTTAPPTTAVPTTAASTTAASTTAASTTAASTTAAPTTVPDDSSNVDNQLPRTGPTEAALLAATGCAMILAGRAALDAVNALDRRRWSRLAIKRPMPPR